jgi:hypothetical protein
VADDNAAVDVCALEVVREHAPEEAHAVVLYRISRELDGANEPLPNHLYSSDQ